MCPARAAAGRETPGCPFLGVPLLWTSKERVQNNPLKIYTVKGKSRRGKL